MLKLLIIGIVGYGVYYLVTKFFIPLAKLVKITHQGINEVKQNMNRQTHSKTKEQLHQTPPKQSDGEYIDYEEVK